MKSLPLVYAVAGRKIVLAGGGAAASAKARLAAAAGAEVLFVAPDFDGALVAEWRGRAAFFVGEPTAGSFDSAALAFVAVDDDGEAARIAALARATRVPVNVVDRPELSDFTMPSIVERGDVVVAISTHGAAPVLARRLREKIEILLPQRLSTLAAFARSFRGAVGSRIDKAARRAFWEQFFDGPIASRILAGDDRGAREAMIEAINRLQADDGVGVVHIVGAGPGDPELLTLKALRLLQSADVIFHDRLVSKEILSFARRDAERFYVGKAKAGHAVAQEEIERRMIDTARQGKIVVRL